MEVKELVQQKFDELKNRLDALQKDGATVEEMKEKVGGLATEFAETKGQLTSVMESVDKLDKFIKEGGSFEGRKQTFQSIVKKALADAKVEAFGGNSKAVQSIELKNAVTMTQASMNGGVEGFEKTYQQEIIRNPFTRTHVRELIPSTALTTETLQYPKLVAQAGGAGVQASEGAAKPAVSYTFDTVQENPITLASTLRISKQMLRAMPQLLAFIQTQMLEDLYLLEDAKLLNGLGGVNDLNGIKTQAPSFAATGTAAGANATIFDYIVNAISQLSQVNYSPNGVLVNPAVFYEMFQMKAADGKYNSPYAGITITDGGIRVLGVPVIQTTTTALDETDFIIGDWNQAQMLVRENMNIELSFDDQDNFIKNLVTIRLEEAIGLAVYRPAGFLKGSFEDVINAVAP